MGHVRPVPPCLLVVAAFSRYESALDWSRQAAEQAWGPIALSSQAFTFDDTSYYEPTMGTGLRKIFHAFDQLIDPASLAQAKLLANELEERYRASCSWPEPRPLNLDPGYLTEAKLVLATTKDRDHRIYLRDGIYAEVTLHYHAGAWRPRDWTYPDYRSTGYHEFFQSCRDFLRQRRRVGPG